MTVFTSNGPVTSHTMGRLKTAHGKFEGYIVLSSPYSLWAMEDEMQKGGVYTQSKHGASIEYPDGEVRHFQYPEGSEPRHVRFRMYKGGPEIVWRLKGQHLLQCDW